MEAITNFSHGHFGPKDFWAKLLAFFVSVNYSVVLMPYLLLKREEDLVERIVVTFVGSLFWTITCAAFDWIYNYFVWMYVRAEMPRAGNEALLDSLKEGVFIVEEQGGEVLFQNTAASLISRRLEQQCSFAVTQNISMEVAMMNINQDQFQLLDKKHLKSIDFKGSLEFLNQLSSIIQRFCQNLRQEYRQTHHRHRSLLEPANQSSPLSQLK